MIQGRFLALLAILLAIGSLGAVCCEGGGSFDEAADRAQLESMRKHIQDLVGTADCSDSDQCRDMAFGSKPCGGPWEYLIYSSETLDIEELEDLVAEYTAFEKNLNKRYGWMSDCSTPNPPHPTCSNGHCVDASKRSQ